MTSHQHRSIRAGLAALLAFGLVGQLVPGRVVAGDDVRKISWREDLAQAQAEARSRDLLLWIQFTGPWCINCRRMDRSTFTHAAVVTSSRERFIPVKLRSDEYENLTASLGLTSLPSTVIVRPNGEVVDKFEGYGEPDEFEGFLQTVLHREGRTAEQIAAKTARDHSLALAGFCPVTLIQTQRLVPGKLELTLTHGGRIYRFATEADRLTFRQHPGSFAPANNGQSPVSQVDKGEWLAGDPRWGIVYGGHLFLFRDGTERDRFAAIPERYAHIDVSDRLSCPHCWQPTRLAGRPNSRLSSAYPVSHLTAITATNFDAFLTPTSVIRR